MWRSRANSLTDRPLVNIAPSPASSCMRRSAASGMPPLSIRFSESSLSRSSPSPRLKNPIPQLSVMRGRGPCARRMLRQILPYLTGGPPSALRSAAGNAPVGESALHAHRGRAVHVRAKARHDRESVSAVERHRGELLVACLEAQPVDVVIDGIVDQGGDERVR